LVANDGRRRGNKEKGRCCYGYGRLNGCGSYCFSMRVKGRKWAKWFIEKKRRKGRKRRRRWAIDFKRK